MKLKDAIDKFYLDDKYINSILLDEDILATISAEDDFYKNNVYFYLLNLYYMNLDKKDYKEVAHISYLISYYLFIIETPFGSEYLAIKYAEEAIKYDSIDKYKEWLEYVKQGN